MPRKECMGKAGLDWVGREEAMGVALFTLSCHSAMYKWLLHIWVTLQALLQAAVKHIAWKAKVTSI